MESKRWEQLELVFQEAVDLKAEDRAKFLDRACHGDEALRREVESLLGQVSAAQAFIETPAVVIESRMLTVDDSTTLAGSCISHYQISSLLGAGGMGRVYLAEDTSLGRQVALKILPVEFTADSSRVRRFEREARAASTLNHPNIVTIHEIGQHDDFHYIVSEFIEGQTLRHRISSSSRLGVRDAVEIALQIAAALKAAHEAGVIHRDIKPENVILRPDGLVKVLDFGIAKLGKERELPDTTAGTDRTSRSGLNTKPGTIIGTSSYMSPEQARGESIDFRTDIFSLGVVIYEMLAGGRPFEGQPLQHDSEPLRLDVLRDDVPSALAEIIRRALKKDQKERYASAGDLLSDLRELDGQLERRSATHLPGLERYRRRLKAKPRRASLSLPKDVAFHGLKAFQETDQYHFFGRGAETLEVYGMVAEAEFRCGVLYGDSGCGKTSLLRAGLIPRLRKEGRLPIYCRSFLEPLAALIEECNKQSGVAIHENESPVNYIRRVADQQCNRDGASHKEIVIICDQFEEFFISFPDPKDREPFISFVATCQNATDLPVKFLFSMRSDFLYRYGQAFDGRIPEPLSSAGRYDLHNFDEKQAAEVIDRLARGAGLPFEADLSLHVARDLASEGAVVPSELQLVGQQLQRKHILNVRDYRRAGGKEPLVYGVLENLIQATGEKETSHLILRSLISEDDTRLTLPLDEIAKRTQRSPQTVRRILDIFVDARLVREIQDGEPWRYELMHEYVIEKINRLTGKVMDATQRAGRKLRQHAANYAVDRSTRIPLGELLFIRRYSGAPRGEHEPELIRKSLRRGLTWVATVTLVLSALSIFAAALMSLGEEWDESTLRDGHADRVRQLALSPDGTTLVSVGHDAKVIVWDLARQERKATLEEHKDRVTAVTFSPDGKWFATASAEGKVIVWHSLSLEKTVALPAVRRGVDSIAFTPDSRRLVATLEDNHYDFWDVGGWVQVRRILGNGVFVMSGVGQWITFGYGKTEDLATGAKLTGPIDPTWSWGALSPDEKQLATVDGGGFLGIWDVSQVRSAGHHKLVDRLPAHRDRGRAVAFSSDGLLIATGGENIILWDSKTRAKLSRFEYRDFVTSLVFTPDVRWLISSHADGAILVWDLKEKEPLTNLAGHSANVRSVCFSSDGKYFASAGDDRSVILWDRGTKRKEAVLLGHETRVSSVNFSRDGQWLVSGDLHGNIILWDVETHERLKSFKPSKRIAEDFAFSVAISPDKRWVASAFGVYHVATGQPVPDSDSALFNNYPEIYGIAFSPDGQYLAVVTSRGKVLLWDVSTWQLTQTASLEATNIIVLSFSPDSKWLATGENQGAVRLWQVKPLREMTVLGRHDSGVTSVVFSPDGHEVASAGSDQTVALWDVEERSLIAFVGTRTASALSVAFSPDGKQLAEGGLDKSVRLYTRHRTVWGHRID